MPPPWTAAGTSNRRLPPPASWPAARGSLPTDAGSGRFVALRDPLRPPMLAYGVGSRVGLALRGAAGTIVRGAGTIVATGQHGGVTVRWIATLARLAGRGPFPPPDLLIRTGPEGVAWVFDSAPAADPHEDRLPTSGILSPTIIVAAHAALPPLAPDEPGDGASQSEPEPDLVIEPTVLDPVPIDTAGHATAVALSTFDIVQHLLAEHPHDSDAAVFGDGPERVACVRDAAAGYDAALYVDPDDRRTRLAIWRPGTDPDAIRVYRTADIHAALFMTAVAGDNAPPSSPGVLTEETAAEALESMVEPVHDLPDYGRCLWSLETTGPATARGLGFVALRPGGARDRVTLVARRATPDAPRTPSRRLSGPRLAAWLLPAAPAAE